MITPGSWILEFDPAIPEDNIPEWAWVWDRDHQNIVMNKAIHNETDRENVKLMVDAPRLLALLEAIQSMSLKAVSIKEENGQ